MIDEKELIRTLGDKMGYGRIMRLCEEIWREKDIVAGRKGGEHTVGPCGFFMVPCPHPVKNEAGHCDICCGAGRITKGVAALLSSNNTAEKAE